MNIKMIFLFSMIQTKVVLLFSLNKGMQYLYAQHINMVSRNLNIETVLDMCYVDSKYIKYLVVLIYLRIEMF